MPEPEPRAPLRIVVANDLYGPSSAAGIAVAQARRLSSMGHEVHFVATVQDPREARTFSEDTGLRVHLLFTPAYSMRWRAWKSLRNRPALLAFDRTLARIRPHVVHFHNVHIHLSYRALRVAKRHGARVVLTVHDVMPFCFQKMFCFVSEDLDPFGPPISFKAPFPRCIPCARMRYNPIRNPWIRWHFRRHADRLIAVSGEMRRALQENGIDGVEVIENGIDPAPAEGSAAAGDAFRERHGLIGRRVVLYGGRLDHRKGAEHLIRAMALVIERVPRAALLVVGSGLGGYESRMLELARELGIEERVVATGWLDQDQMAGAYAAADVICTPSLIFESFGLINAEGMLRGKPAVTSFFGGPKDVVEHGETGFHVNPLRVEELATRLATLLSDDRLRASMGEKARARVLERFHLDRQTQRVETLYRDVLAGGNRP